MTRNEFVLQITEAIKENPRPVLAGHGIKPTILNQLIQRDDLLAKIASVVFQTKYAKKGAKGMKKTSNFRILAYKNFMDLQKNGANDINNFIGGLSTVDMSTFQNSENIIAFLALPDSTDGTTEENIVAGKSVAMTFAKAISKEYKIPNGFYVLVCWGDSVIRPQVVAKAKVKSKTAIIKEKRRTAARIKTEIKAKTRKLSNLQNAISSTTSKKAALQMQLQQFHNVASGLGIDTANQKTALSGIRSYDSSVKKAFKTVKKAEKPILDATLKAIKKGKMDDAKVLASHLSPELANHILSGNPGSFKEATKNRAAEIRRQIRELTKSNEQLLVDMSLAPTNSLKRSIQTKIKRQNEMVKTLKIKLKGILGDNSLKTIRNKKSMIEAATTELEAMLSKGADLKTAIANATAKLNKNTTPQERQQIRQEIVQQIASGIPQQIAVQQAIQQLPVQQFSQALTPQQVAQQYAQYQVGQQYMDDPYAMIPQETVQQLPLQLQAQQLIDDEENFEDTGLSGNKTIEALIDML